MKTIIAGTGHRPDKLGGYDNEASFGRLIHVCTDALKEYDTDLDKVISGMAQGFDQALALAAIKMEIPLTAAIPCDGFESRWPVKARDLYNQILKCASEVKIVSPGPYAVYKMQARNIWMVDNCTLLLALYNNTPGGTRNCIEYAKKVDRKINNLWEKFST